MKPKMKFKMLVDLVMTCLLLFLMAYQVTGDAAHEWLGMGMFCLFLTHNILNIRWYKSLFKGKYTALRILQTAVNLLVFLSMIGLMISGIMMSRHVFAFLSVGGSMSFARILHLVASYWGFALMSVHLGLHWGMVIGMMRRLANGKVLSAAGSILRAAAFAAAAYGAYVFYTSNIVSYMFLQNQFVFMDYEQSALSVLTENLVMMGMWVFIAYYGSRLLQKTAGKKNKGQKNKGQTTDEQETRIELNFRKKGLNMKKMISMLLILSMLLTLTACGGTPEQREQETAGSTENNSSSDDESPAAPESEEMPSENMVADSNGQGRVLIAYFTWAENAVQDSDVDAMTSPSVTVPGDVAQLADWVQEGTGGDMFSIQVTEPYSSDWDECLERANEEKGDDARPELTEAVENMDDYDVVFLGYPNWWYSAPMAIFSFIEENDLSGKSVYLFCSHGTGGLASSVQDISAALPDSTISDNVFDVYEEDAATSQSEVQNWLEELGY